MDWNTFRAEFPVTRRWAYLDHAAVAPIPVRTRDAMAAWTDDVAANGHINEAEWEKRVEAVRALAGSLLNADPQDVAFIKNTSEGIGFVAEGFPWRPGDEVVTAAEEYPSNIYPWMNLASRGVQLRLVPSRGNRLEIEDIAAALTERTRLLTISLVEFSSGFRNDLDALGRLCRERGVFFFVDAIQGLGVFPVDVRRSLVDGLAADGHKWLLGPQGAGIFYLRREWVDRLHPVSVGWNSVRRRWDFSRVDFTLKDHAGRWENGTPNFAGILGLGTSLEMLAEAGRAEVERRVLQLTDHLCERAEQAGFGVFSSRRPGEASGIVSVIVEGADPRTLVRRLREHGVVINQRAGRIRFSPHCYNTEEEIDRAVELLRVHRAS